MSELEPTGSSSWGRPLVALAVSIFVVAVVLRICIAVTVPMPPTDYIAMEELGLSLWQDGEWSSPRSGEGFELIRTPLFPFIIGGLITVVGSSLTTILLFNGLCTLAASVLVAELFRRSGASPRVVVLAFGMTALSPHSISLGGRASGEAVFMLVAVSLVFALVSGFHLKLAGACLVGVGVGLAYLVRPEAILLTGWVVAFQLLGDRRRPLGQRLALVTVTASAVLVTIMPYLVVIHDRTGSWSLSGKSGLVFEQAVSSVDDTAKWEDSSLDAASPMDRIRDDPGLLVRLVKQHGVTTVGYLATWNLPLILLAILLASQRLKRRRVESCETWFPVVVAAAVMSIIGVYFVFHAEQRYLLAFQPVLVIAALALEDPWSTRSPTRRRVYGLASVLVVVYGLLASLTIVVRHFDPVYLHGRYAVEHKAAGLWLKDGGRVDPDGLVISRKAFVAYYAETRSGGPGRTTLGMAEALLDMRARGADLLVIDDRFLVASHPRLAPLFEPEIARRNRLRLLYSNGNPVTGQRIFVYRFE